MTLEDIVGTVDGWAAQLEVMRGDFRLPCERRVKHDSLKLIQCIRASRLLVGGAAALRRSAQQHILATMPPLLAQCLAD